jgi:hypothetical protein
LARLQELQLLTALSPQVPGEDPFHSGEYGTAVVNGVQWSGDGAGDDEGSVGGKNRVISDCHFTVQLNHFIPGFQSYSVALFLK